MLHEEVAVRADAFTAADDVESGLSSMFDDLMESPAPVAPALDAEVFAPAVADAVEDVENFEDFEDFDAVVDQVAPAEVEWAEPSEPNALDAATAWDDADVVDDLFADLGAEPTAAGAGDDAL
jgi:hypothetical protein